MLANNTLHKGMYNIMQEWYNYINDNIHIQADLIGMSKCLWFWFLQEKQKWLIPLLLRMFSLLANDTRSRVRTHEGSWTLRRNICKFGLLETTTRFAWRLANSWTQRSPCTRTLTLCHPFLFVTIHGIGWFLMCSFQWNRYSYWTLTWTWTKSVTNIFDRRAVYYAPMAMVKAKTISFQRTDFAGRKSDIQSWMRLLYT